MIYVVGFIMGVAAYELWREASHRWTMRRTMQRLARKFRRENQP